MKKPPCPRDISPLDLLLAGGPEAFAPYVPTAEEAAAIADEAAKHARWDAERIARIDREEAERTERRLRREFVGRRIGW